ncbi:Trichome birefringence-like, N-terminal domain [Dillenia turbinata]|uniref:Trichome birefringence-like, N-terminal domain n=1 Tax=Dillenia turbinata TaxID=194707 RepID=A0AAN8YSA0_9MAGN
MRVYASDLPNGKNKHNSRLAKSVVFLALTLFTTVVFLHLLSNSPWMSIRVQSCDLLRGRWIRDQNGPYYTNVTFHYIIEEQNCMKFGRPDTVFKVADTGFSDLCYSMRMERLWGCQRCFNRNIPPLTRYYECRKAFETAFTSLLNLQYYNGVTFLRAFSPGHFENGSWDKGGNCPRTIPFTSQEISLDGDFLGFNLIQKEEFRKAKNEGKKKGLRFRMIDTTEPMLMRPDGHPNYHGHTPGKNKSRADCVHWCLPGPIDTWNELLLQMLKTDV